MPGDEYDVVIGIDTHRDFHVAVALAPNGGKLDEIRILTVQKGYETLISWPELFGSRPVFAMEGTSSSGAGLCREHIASSFPVVEANRPDRKTLGDAGRMTLSMLGSLPWLSWQALRWQSTKPEQNTWR